MPMKIFTVEANDIFQLLYSASIKIAKIKVILKIWKIIVIPLEVLSDIFLKIL